MGTVTVDAGSRPAVAGWRATVGECLHRLPAGLHRYLPMEQRADLRHRLGRYRPWEEGFDLTPPEPGPGEDTGPPHYVGVGATLSGAGWWHRLITGHPVVWARPDLPAGRHFLSHFSTDRFGPDQVQMYHRWFPRPVGTVAGEWSPSYSSLPWVVPLLARAAPSARVLMMVRDPVERLSLAFAHCAEQRVSQVGTAMAGAVDRGFYGAQLAAVLTAFPRAAVLVLQYEQCALDPDGQLARTFAFLGLDDTHRVAPTPAPFPLGTTSAQPFDTATRARLVALYADDVARLAALVPDLDRSLWPSAGRV